MNQPSDSLTLTLPNGVAMSFQYIPSGEFLMGSRGYNSDEEPRHLVRVSPFYMGTYPVTQEQYAAWKPEHENHYKDRASHPAESLDWYDACGFCAWLSDVCETIPADFASCLPTEAEWEYACRAGTETEYFSGDGESALTEVGWYGEDGSSGSTHIVGSKKRSNGFGLHDMHGNVWEWCYDAFEADVYKRRVGGARDPVAHGDKKAVRVFRGGGWNDSPGGCRSACRGGGRPGDWFGDRGFRVGLFSRAVLRTQGRSPSGERGGQAGRRSRAELAAPPGGAGEIFRDIRLPQRDDIEPPPE